MQDMSKVKMAPRRTDKITTVTPLAVTPTHMGQMQSCVNNGSESPSNVVPSEPYKVIVIDSMSCLAFMNKWCFNDVIELVKNTDYTIK